MGRWIHTVHGLTVSGDAPEEVALLEGLASAAAGDYRGAIRNYDLALESNDMEVRGAAMFRKGQALGSLQDVRGAMQCFSEVRNDRDERSDRTLRTGAHRRASEGSPLQELDRTVGQLESVERVVRNSNNEKRELQAQLSETIASYTEAIEKLHQQLTPSKGGPAAALQLQIHDGRALNSRLQLEAQELRHQVEEEKAAGDDGPAAQKRARAIDAFKSEIAKLRAQINALAGNAEMHSQRDPRSNRRVVRSCGRHRQDMTRADELRRLRSDVSSLNREKEALEQSVAQADKEKEDLIENFLYTKDRLGCLDKLQIACINSPACSPEHEREVAQLRDTYNQVVDERNRLMVRVEAMDKDREKQKQIRESALEKVSQANARLLEERDRLEKDRSTINGLR
eukprot:g283.t1